MRINSRRWGAVARCRCGSFLEEAVFMNGQSVIKKWACRRCTLALEPGTDCPGVAVFSDDDRRVSSHEETKMAQSWSRYRARGGVQ